MSADASHAPAAEPLAEWPRLLDGFDRPPGAWKLEFEDFLVDEQPAYEFSGSGSHTLLQIEKNGLTTQQAIAEVARRLGVSRHSVGYAGLKDARAVTRQWLSVEHVEPDRVAAIQTPRLRVLQVTQHGNKLKLGHLAGNAFVLKIRNTPLERANDVHAALDQLARRGAPNYFGPQRFGARGDGHRIGRAIVRGEEAAAVDVLLGGEPGGDPTSASRTSYARGDYAEALRTWPRHFRAEHAVLRRLARSGDKRSALRALDRRQRDFLVAAYQSHMFNHILAERVSLGLEKIELGDLACVHSRGSVFRVEDPSVEQPRADALEISPTGPIFGYRMTECDGDPGARERHLLTREGLTLEDFRQNGLRVKGARRPLRQIIHEARLERGEDRRGAFLEISFRLASGGYATTVLRELFSDAG